MAECLGVALVQGSVTLFNSSHPQGQDVSPSPPADSPEIADLGGRLTYQPEPVQPCSGYPSTFGHELNDFAKAVSRTIARQSAGGSCTRRAARGGRLGSRALCAPRHHY